MLELPEGPVERLNARSEGLGDLTVFTAESLELGSSETYQLNKSNNLKFAMMSS